MENLTYTLIQVTSTWSPNLMDWEEDDRLYVGEVELPIRRPVESESFAKLLEPEDIPLLINTELNAYGHRTIEIGTHDGQKMYELVSQKPEPEGETGKEDGYGGIE